MSTFGLQSPSSNSQIPQPPLMGTLQNQSPNLYPNRSILPNSNPILNTNPNPNQSPNPNPATGLKSPSFEEVSKLFSLPLSDAADSLGICPSVLKKVCYDNGLVRWPYRKFVTEGCGVKFLKVIGC
ncbi:protein nlp1 [Phtheirospermum japonicum]|uniref:Protein nlp1 n=1 Tax=Phtheirospermum japonicum TaxID=374723 RepID=A0A830DB73_9LAMI|nr:protein nlp1 [Phtheirospermum japonicum]